MAAPDFFQWFGAAKFRWLPWSGGQLQLRGADALAAAMNTGALVAAAIDRQPFPGDFPWGLPSATTPVLLGLLWRGVVVTFAMLGSTIIGRYPWIRECLWAQRFCAMFREQIAGQFAACRRCFSRRPVA